MKANMIIQSAQQQMDMQGRIPWGWYLQAYIKTNAKLKVDGEPVKYTDFL
jgi:hypothetical protein